MPVNLVIEIKKIIPLLNYWEWTCMIINNTAFYQIFNTFPIYFIKNEKAAMLYFFLKTVYTIAVIQCFAILLLL